MKLRRTWALDGPNAWIDRPAIRVLLDAGNATADDQARLELLMSGFSFTPKIEQTGSAPPDPTPSFDAGNLLALIVMELQQLAGDQVSFSLSSPGKQPGQFDVVCESVETDLALAAAEVAVRFLNHLVYETEPGFDFNREFNRHVMWHIRYRDSQKEQQAAIEAAKRRDIPFRFVDKHQRLVDFGLGAFTERYLAIMTSKSIEIASRIARNKPLAKAVMREHGVPVPDGGVVRNVEEAIRIVEQIGYPVVVKPSDLKHGTAVTVGIRTPEELAVAVESAVAASKSGRALVEAMILGRDYRITVVGDNVCRIVERIPAHVIGDGEKTVAELIAIVNEEPERQPGHTGRFPIPIDEGTLAALNLTGMTLESVPHRDQHVTLRLVANVHQGGTTIFRTGEIHPDTEVVSRLAAKAVGLEVCGLDLITPDLSQSIWEVGGAVIEVNSEPQTRVSSSPEIKGPIEFGIAILEMFFPPDRPYQPKIVAMASRGGEHSPAPLIGRIARASGLTAGLATHSRTEFEGAGFTLKRSTDRPEIESVVRNPYVTGAVLEIVQQHLEESGLPFLHCDVVIIGPDGGSQPLPGARPVAQVLCGLVSSSGTIIVDPTQTALDVATLGPAEQVLLTCLDADHPEVRLHNQQGGRSITLIESTIVFRSAGSEVSIIDLDSINANQGDIAPYAVLQAIAAGIALDVPIELMRSALAEST